MPQLVRFAVVGAQGYSREHLRYVQMLTEAGKAVLAASTMIDKDDHPDLVAQLESDGVPVFEEYGAMLDACTEQADVVTLPVPIHLHAPMAIAALNAGYHVLVEKPLAGSLRDVDEMIAARDASGKGCAVGFQQIYSPVIQALKRRFTDGKMGAVMRICIMALWPRDPSYYGRNNWAGKLCCDGRPVYDSPFNNALSHEIMNALYLAFPEVGRAAYPAHVQAELLRAYDIETFDTGCVRVRTDSDAEIFFAASHACDTTVDPLIRVEAEKASVAWEFRGDATITYADGTHEIIAQDEPRGHMFHTLVQAMTGPVFDPLCTLEIARAHVACIEAIHQVAPIVDVAPQLVSVAPQGQRVIAGIEPAVQQAFETGKLFSELGIDFT